MKLNVVYALDISCDNQGIVQCCQCECGAGMGPHAHCKHVCAILYGLTKFCECGDFKTQLTCTQQLQTFHQVKKHTGSPMKVSQLTLPFSTNIDFDPRPAKFVNQVGYQDYFRNACINSTLFHDAAISQVFYPANPHAVILDHCYLYADSLDPFDEYLKSLRITEITETEISDIQSATIGQITNPVWKTEKQKRLTASNFGQICKLTERANASKIAKSYLAVKELHCAAVQHGRSYESVAVSKYEKQTGNKTQQCGLFVCKQYPYLGATPDRVVAENLLLEVKCPFSAKDSMISAQTVPYLTDANGSLQLDTTHNYYYQVQGQLLCTGASAVDFVVYTLNDIFTVRIFRDDEFIDQMAVKLNKFFTEYFRQAVLDKFVLHNYYDYISCNCVRFNKTVQ